jgi:C1A family cysteine protease
MDAKYKLNYKFREPDSRDYIYVAKNKQTIVKKKELNVGSIYDQKNIGSCVSNALVKSLQMTEGSTYNKSSRLFVYFMARLNQGSDTSQDTGCNIRKAASAIRWWGVSNETSWPYDTKKFAEIPSIKAFQSSKTLEIEYGFIEAWGSNRLEQIKIQINDGNPVCFGIQVYDSFMNTGKDGLVKSPQVLKEKHMGGHCMVITGYNDETQHFTVCNSWGTGWGKNGMCYIPYIYMAGVLASDFCLLQKPKPGNKKK